MTNLGSVLKGETSLSQQMSIQSKLWFSQWSCTDVRIGPSRRLSTKDLMLLNCGAGEDSWESHGLQEGQASHSKGNQPWIFIGRLMLKLKLWYFDHLMQRADSLEKTLMLGKTEGQRRGRWRKIRWLDTITNSVDMNLSKMHDSGRQSSLVCCSQWGCKESDPIYWLNNNSLLKK